MKFRINSYVVHYISEPKSYEAICTNSLTWRQFLYIKHIVFLYRSTSCSLCIFEQFSYLYCPYSKVLLTAACTTVVEKCFVYSLIYMAGLCYQWLKNDVLSRDLLRTGELILVKVVYVVTEESKKKRKSILQL